MSHVWGLDSASPPDAATAAALKAQGWAFFGGYIGPAGRAERVWTKAEFATVARAGLQVLAFWIAPLSGDPGYDQGVSEGNAALAAMQARGLTGWLQIDAESGVGPRGWMRGFMDALHAGACKGRLYGTSASIAAIGDLADSWYLAGWPTPDTAEALPMPDWDVWQYSTGPAYDYNVAVDTLEFTGVVLD